MKFVLLEKGFSIPGISGIVGMSTGNIASKGGPKELIQVLYEAQMINKPVFAIYVTKFAG